MIRAVLFDMDGTLIDSMPLYEKAWRISAEEIGFTGDLLAHRNKLAGMSRSDIGIYLKGQFGQDFPHEELSRHRDAYILKSIGENGVPFKPGVPDILDDLHQMGCKLALVASSAKQRVDFIFEKTGLNRYFDAVVTGDDVLHSKPEPDIFLLGAKLLGIAPQECAVAEDAPAGVLAGYRAEMKVAMIPDLQPVNDEIRPLLWKTGETLFLLPQWVEEENEKCVEI